uniref:Uncharacterized protein n=1 Tax=viral metagenome TaxID=1070528 RepID=A0A6C0BNC5_9ZZZZ
MSEGHLLQSLSNIVEIHHPSGLNTNLTISLRSRPLENQIYSIRC